MEAGSIALSELKKSNMVDLERSSNVVLLSPKSSRSLATHLRDDPKVSCFLIATGFMDPMWPDKPSAFDISINCALSILCWISRLGLPFLFVYLLCDNLIYSIGFFPDTSQYYQWVCNQLQILAVIPLVIRTRKRLNSTAVECEVQHYSSKLKISIVFCILALFFSLLFFSVRPTGSDTNTANTHIGGHQFMIAAHYPVIAFGEFLLACTMSVCLLFILVDIEVSKSIVQSLIEKTKSRTLTVDGYNEARQEVDRRVDDDYYSISTVVVVVFLNIIAFFLRIFVTETNHGVGALLAACNYYLKEIFFILFCYYDASLVNELVDKNIRELGFQSWGNAEDELRRVQVFMNAISKPISFELAGLRFKRKDILVKFGSIALASLIGFIRLLVLSSNSNLIHR